MKIGCDACGRAEAAVLCCADEAALCRRCDAAVHSANRLAGRHSRVALLPSTAGPSPPDGSGSHPACDICQLCCLLLATLLVAQRLMHSYPYHHKYAITVLQPQVDSFSVPRCIRWQEKTGYFFCLEDRALLCRPCDVAVHAAGAHVASHSRFLITGVRVGAGVECHHAPAGVAVSPSTSSGNGSSGAPSNPTMTMPDKVRPSSSSVIAAVAGEGLGGQQWPWSEFLADDAGVGMDQQDLCCPAGISEPGSSSLTG